MEAVSTWGLGTQLHRSRYLDPLTPPSFVPTPAEVTRQRRQEDFSQPHGRHRQWEQFPVMQNFRMRGTQYTRIRECVCVCIYIDIDMYICVGCEFGDANHALSTVLLEFWTTHCFRLAKLAAGPHCSASGVSLLWPRKPQP